MSLISPEDQRATFVELFFDLVYVFSVTQLVGMLAQDLDWVTIGEGLLVFWLVWWAWTQFTWALNAANTEHPVVQLFVLGATGIAFLMAVSLPDAFQGRALGFAAPYVLVRLLGLSLYARVTAMADPFQYAAVQTFGVASFAGLMAVLVGAVLGGAGQYWFWGLAIVLDVIAAGIAGRAADWNIYPEHFGERHGLFVIIALGETLIVAAAGLTGAEWTGPLAAVASIAVAVSCALWWSYFRGPKSALERGLRSTDPVRKGRMARDTYSLAHFPMLCGIIAFAVAVEEAVAHPVDPLSLGGRLALGVSLLLFLGGTAAAVRRATGRVLGFRLAMGLATAVAVTVVSGAVPALSLAIALGGVATTAGFERWPDSPALEV